MRKFLMATGLLCAGCGSSGDFVATNSQGVPESRPATILVKMSNQPTSDQAQQAAEILDDSGAVAQAQLPNNVQQLQVAPSHEGAEQALCDQLMASGAVEFAEPDYKLEPVFIPNDSYYGQQWHLPKISAPAAWDLVRGKSTVTVAVCDTGVLATHPDLSANLLAGYNAVDGSTNTAPVHPHGTMVSGCISGIGNNSQGVAGVAFGVKILPVRVTNDASGSAYLSDMANGVRWAADHGARVINLSYGGAQYATIDQAAQYARSKNALLFMAAGNDGADVSTTYPDYGSFVLVGATNPSDARSSFSNYGTAIDMVAPGETIVTTTLNNGYASVAGTSFASPITAAGAALMLSANPNLSVSQLETNLMAACDDIGTAGEDKVFGKGRLNTLNAVRKAQTIVPNLPPVANLTASPLGAAAPVNITWNASASSDPEGGALSYNWSFSDGGSATGNKVVRSYTAGGNYSATVSVTDPQGASISTSLTVVVKPDPRLVNAPSNLSATLSGSTLTLSWKDNSSNENGFYVERAYQNTAPGVFKREAALAANATSYRVTLTPGTYLFRVQAYNSTYTSSYTSILGVSR
ncbi:S8 family serine peptidase [bacterium]|nr:S8 family serine peptidase [bacterium]